MSKHTQDDIRTVVGVYSSSERIVTVRVGTGSAHVRMLENSRMPVRGESVLVLELATGRIGIALEPASVSSGSKINWQTSLPPGDSFVQWVKAGTITGWKIRTDAAGDITIDVLVNGSSITGANPIIVTGSAGPGSGDITGWTTALLDSDEVHFDVTYFDTVTELSIVLEVI